MQVFASQECSRELSGLEWCDWNRWYPRPGTWSRTNAADRPWPEDMFCLRQTTLMSRFNSWRHECSSPARFGSEVSVDDRAWQGAAAEDDGRANSDARVGCRRTSVRLGAASV